MSLPADIRLPEHIAIIMDGNGRWAKQHHVPRQSGHAKGAEVFKTIAKYCESLEIKALTVYAFSTENWSRSETEVRYLMKLFREYLDDAFTMDSNSRIRFLGEKSRLPEDLLALMKKLEDDSSSNDGMVLNIALNYGGRAEITGVVRKIAEDAAEGRLSVGEIDEQLVSSYLYTAGLPDPDIILRPSGEKRISNFLLWQCAYSEFIYMDVLWPDFTTDMLDEAIVEYNKRNRRFGGR
ncbi:MAG: isoprenyl transferase [Oscillospiraceae bacterium]|nr:isoprenyl transferase [Oscillospiraceae bacterium]